MTLNSNSLVKHLLSNKTKVTKRKKELKMNLKKPLLLISNMKKLLAMKRKRKC